MKYSLFIILAIISIFCFADVYMQKDKNGTTTYSDVPLNSDAKKIETPEINSVSSPSATTVEQHIVIETPQPVSAKEVVIVQKQPYTVFMISSPANEETIQNQPVISVDIKIIPNLQIGDVIQIYLDGVPIGKPAPSTHFQFAAPERGTHHLSAKLMDKTGLVLKVSPSNTVYIHQAALGASPPRIGSGI